MRSNRKHTVKELEKYIQLYLEEGKSFRELRDYFGLLLSDQAFDQKVLRYQGHGLSGIQNKSQNNHYSKQFKEMVIQEHLQKGIPVRWLARKYNIPSHETVRRWISPEVYEKSKAAPPLEGLAGKQHANPMNIAVYKNSKSLDAAVEFAKFVTNDDNQIAFAQLAE